MPEMRFALWEVTFVFSCLSLSLIEVDVNAVSPCINRVELLERLLISSRLGNYINATSFIPPHLPSEATTSGIGWCSDDLACSSEERQVIEIDFGAEVTLEAVAILRAGGSYVTHYSVEYAKSNRDFQCISGQFTNESVFSGNRTCNVNMEPSNFTNPVVTRFVRIIPVQWVGASACLRMALYGCTIKECRTVRTLPSSFYPESPFTQGLSNLLCSSSFGTQIVMLSFNESLYLTQLRARSNSVDMNIFFNTRTNQTLYQNTIGMNIFRLVFNTRVVIPLWLPINTTVLELLLFPTNNLIQVCFSVELTGCQSGDVIDHTEDGTMSSTSSMLVDNTGTCNRPKPTPASSESLTLSTSFTSVIIVRSTSFVVVTTTSTVKVTPSAMVQQNEVSMASDSDDNCNIVAIVVPTVLVVIALIVIVCINVIVIVKIMKRRKEDIVTSINTHTTSCIVENDLYQSRLQDSAKQPTNYYSTGIVSQYSEVGAPDGDSPTVSGGDDVQVYSKVADNREYDYLTQPPLDGNSRIPEYEVVADTNSAEQNTPYYTVPKAPTVAINPSYATCDPVVNNTDEQ